MRSIKRRLSLLTLTLSGLVLMSSAAEAAVSSAQQSATTARAPVAKAAAKTPAATATISQSAAAKSAAAKSIPAKSTSAKSTPAKSTPAKSTKRRRVPDNPEVRSSALLVVDEDDAAVLLSRNADIAVPIASITKLMTALVVLEAKQPLAEKIEITRDDRAVERGAASRLAVGTILSRGDLLHLALMSSENRAAHALGRSYPGGTDAFLRAMNLKATALGMKHAQFADASGLSSENIASPADLSKLVIAASRNPTIRSYSTDPEHVVSIGRGTVEFRNTNNLVRKQNWDIVVQKTGYTEAAGRCLVMKTVVNDRPVVMVLMNSFGKYTRVADAARIRRWIETGPHQPQLRAATAGATAVSTLRSSDERS